MVRRYYESGVGMSAQPVDAILPGSQFLWRVEIIGGAFFRGPVISLTTKQTDIANRRRYRGAGRHGASARRLIDVAKPDAIIHQRRERFVQHPTGMPHLRD